MSAVVIDTNVLHVANGSARQAGSDCVLQVIDRLGRIRGHELVSLDQTGFILQEYIQQRFQFSGQPGVGDAFFRWVHQNQANPQVCEIVCVTAVDQAGTSFAEFPNDPDLAGFDASDRKFVAVAISSAHKPPVLNAVDSDWWDYRDVLSKHSVDVEFLCPGQFS